MVGCSPGGSKWKLKSIAWVGLFGAALICSTPVQAIDYNFAFVEGDWDNTNTWVTWTGAEWVIPDVPPGPDSGIYLDGTSPSAKCNVVSNDTAYADFIYLGRYEAYPDNRLEVYGSLDLTQPGGSWHGIFLGNFDAANPGSALITIHPGGALTAGVVESVNLNNAHTDMFVQDGGTVEVTSYLLSNLADTYAGRIDYQLNGGTATIASIITGSAFASGSSSNYLTININGGTLITATNDFLNCVLGGAIQANGVVVTGENLASLLALDETTSPGNVVVVLRPAITGISLSGDTLTVTFTGGELESAPTVAGSWTGTGNTSGVYSESVVGVSGKFFRVHGQ